MKKFAPLLGLVTAGLLSFLMHGQAVAQATYTLPPNGLSQPRLMMVPIGDGAHAAPASAAYPLPTSGVIATVQATPTVQAAAYAAGASVGGVIQLTTAGRVSGASGFIHSVTASFTSGVQPSLDVVLFSANPTGSTITDKTAVAIVAADVGKVIGVVHITDCSLLGTTAPSMCQGQNLAMPFSLPTGQTVYAAVILRAAATLTSTSDLTITARVLQN